MYLFFFATYSLLFSSSRQRRENLQLERYLREINISLNSYFSIHSSSFILYSRGVMPNFFLKHLPK